MSRPRLPARGRRGAGAVLALVALAGCSTLLAARDAQRRADRLAVLSGTVTTAAAPRGPLVVALLTPEGDGYDLVDHFVAAQPGPWLFAVEPGTYRLAAFEDVNRNGRYDDAPYGEPAEAQPFVLDAGARRTDIELVIGAADRPPAAAHVPLAALVARDPEHQHHRSLYVMSQLGTVLPLDDARFDRAVAQAAMWDFYDFLVQERAGIYFLAPYDDDRLPVLFVHGMAGTPRDFTTLIAALDGTCVQPWVAYYPTGSSLEHIVGWLDQLVTRLEVGYGVERVVVVAHSMGGLVARGLVLEHQRRGSDTIAGLVTIASPFGGLTMAGEGVAHSPVVVRSWYGLAPGNPFLEGLFYADAARTRRHALDDGTPYHLLFAYHGSDASDGVVPLASQLRPEAQDDAASVRGYHATHRSILADPAVAARLRELLVVRCE